MHLLYIDVLESAAKVQNFVALFNISKYKFDGAFECFKENEPY